jgi:hypothetical protein
MIRVKVLFIVMMTINLMNVSAQQKSLDFDASRWDFGDIAEDGGKVEHTFIYKNNSSKPIVILNVRTGCGCTSSQYSRKPIAAGASGEFKVVFDPMNRPGRFVKNINITTSAADEPVGLWIEGNVLPRKKSVEEQYPFDLGGGVRLEPNFHAFSYVARGESVKAVIGWANTSKRDVRIRLIPRESSGLLQVDIPDVLPAGEKGVMTIIYKVEQNAPRYGTLNDVFDIEVDGKPSRTLFSTNAVAVDKFDRECDDISMPIAVVPKKYIKFAEVKHSSVVIDESLKVANEGGGDLIIRAVEYAGKGLQCSLKAGDIVKAGKSVTVKFTLDSSECDYGVWTDRVRIITNDPVHPMQSLRVTAIIVD